MAKAVKKEGMYHVFYKSFSAITHGLTFDANVSSKNHSVVYEPIRNCTDIDYIFQLTCNISFDTYRHILKHYRPGELDSFGKKYINDWQQRFHQIKKVDYTDGTYTIHEKTNKL